MSWTVGSERVGRYESLQEETLASQRRPVLSEPHLLRNNRVSAQVHGQASEPLLLLLLRPPNAFVQKIISVDCNILLLLMCLLFWRTNTHPTSLPTGEGWRSPYQWL